MTFDAGVSFLQHVSYIEDTNAIIATDNVEMLANRVFSATRDADYNRNYSDGRELANIFGFDFRVNEITLPVDIGMEYIRSQSWRTNFMDLVMMQIAMVKQIDIAKMVSQGYSTAGNTTIAGKDIRKYLLGYVHMLLHMDGTNTFSTQAKNIKGAFEHRVTPTRLSIGTKANAGDTAIELDTTALANWDGYDTDTLIQNMQSAMPVQFANNANHRVIMSRADYEAWARTKSVLGQTVASTVVGVNVPARDQRQFGAIYTNGVPNLAPYGVPVIIDYNAKAIKLGGVVVLGDPMNILVGRQTGVENTSMVYNARGSYGSTWEYTNAFYMGTSIENRQAMVIAGSNLIWTANGASAALTTVVQAPAPYIVADDKRNNVAPKTTFAASETSGNYVFTSMHPDNYVVYVAPVANTTYAGIITNTEDTYSAGDDLSALTAGTYNMFTRDLEGYLSDSAITAIVVS
jgi:hypothetical protein